MKKYSKALVNIGVALIMLLGIIFLLPRLLIFFMPFVVGWIIALIAGPLVHFFEEKVKLKRKIGSAFVIVAVIALVVLLIYLVGTRLVRQLIGLIGELPEMWQSMASDLEKVAGRIGEFMERLSIPIPTDVSEAAGTIGGYIGDLFGKISTPTIAAAGNLAKFLPGFFIGLIMTLLSAYFFVAERMQINEWFRKNMPAVIQLRYHMIRNSLVRSVGGYLKAQLKIEVWMYLLLLAGLGVLRVNYYGLIALVIAILDFLPFLGTGTVLIPWAVFKILTADYGMAVGLLIIWGGGQLARQLIQPKIVGDSIGVPPLPTLFLLYIGYKLGGVVGMIVAVPVGLLVYSMYQEGAFDTTKNSVLVLIAGLNRFRRLNREEMYEVEAMAARNRERVLALDRQREEEELAKKAEKEEKKRRKRRTAKKDQEAAEDKTGKL